MTALGIADATGSPIAPEATIGGRPVFRVAFGSGFVVFVEGRVGPSGLDVGPTTFNRSASDPGVRPDLQIESSRALGDGSPAACDNSAPVLGGVPGVDPADFGPSQAIADALNDLGCRFTAFNGADFPCTQDGSGNFAFTNPNTTLQFCVLVSTAIGFPQGDTVVTARLRDTGGSVGISASVIVRVTQDAGP